MGGAPSSVGIAGTPVKGCETLLGLTLDEIQGMHKRYIDNCEVPGLDCATLQLVLAPPEAALSVFNVFSGGRAVVDIHEIFAVMILTSKAPPAARRKIAFDLFDSDGSSQISLDEMVIMLRAILRGIARLTGGTAPSVEACEATAKACFEAADAAVSDGLVTYAEFSAWLRVTTGAATLLGAFDSHGHLTSDTLGAIAREREKAAKAASRPGGTAAASSAAGGSGSPARPAAAAPAADASRPSAAAAHKGRPTRDKVSSKYSKEEVLTLREVFRGMDKDGSGQVDATEFSRSMAGSGAAGSSAGMFTVMDKDQNGLITFEEILRETYKKASAAEMDQLIRWGREEARVKASARPTATEEQLSAAGDLFDAYDGDRSGALSLSEITTALTRTGVYTERQVKDIFKGLAGGGSVSRSEFVDLMAILM